MRELTLVAVLFCVGCGSAASSSSAPRQQTYAEALDVFTNEMAELTRLRARENEAASWVETAKKINDRDPKFGEQLKQAEVSLADTTKAKDAQIIRVEAAKKAKEDAWAREQR